MNIFVSKSILPFRFQRDLEIFLEMSTGMTHLYYSVMPFRPQSALVNSTKGQFPRHYQNLYIGFSKITVLLPRPTTFDQFESILTEYQSILFSRWNRQDHHQEKFCKLLLYLRNRTFWNSPDEPKIHVLTFLVGGSLGRTRSRIPDFIFLWVTILLLCFEIFVKITVSLCKLFINDEISARSNQKSWIGSNTKSGIHAQFVGRSWDRGLVLFGLKIVRRSLGQKVVSNYWPRSYPMIACSGKNKMRDDHLIRVAIQVTQNFCHSNFWWDGNILNTGHWDGIRNLLFAERKIDLIGWSTSQSEGENISSRRFQFQNNFLLRLQNCSNKFSIFSKSKLFDPGLYRHFPNV